MSKKRNRECPKCRELGHDKKGDHLFLMADNETWCCTREEYHPVYFEREGESLEYTPPEERDEQEKVDIASLPPCKLYIRSISPRVLDKYGVRATVDGSGNIKEHYYPITKDGKVYCHKVRVVDGKKFFTTKSTKGVEVDLFGIPTIPTKKPEHIIVTEGELDAMTLYEVLSRSYKNLYVLSMPLGADSLMSLKTNHDLLMSAKTLTYYPDQDEPGLKAVEKIAKLFKDIKIMYTSEKDACDMVEAGKTAELIDSFVSAEKYKPKSIITVANIITQAITPVEMGLSYPFPTLTEKTYGLRTKQLIGIGAAPGAGKTTLVEGIQKHIMYNHGEKVAIFALEEDPSWTLKKLVGSVMNLPIHLPGTKYDPTIAKSIADSFDGKAYFFDSYEYVDWDSIEQAIRYFHSEGVKYFFIDPLSALVAHLSASDANTFLGNAMYSMSKLVKILDITIFHINHLNNPTGSKDHGAGGRVYGGQFSGSRAQWKFSTAMWGLERDQTADDDSKRNEVVLRIIKDRMAGANGVIPLIYDKKTGTLEEAPMKVLGIGGF